MENTTVELLTRIVQQNEQIIELLAKQAAPLEAAELMQAPANNIQRIDVVLTYCDMVSILNSPAEGFTPEFTERVHELAPLMFRARPQVKGGAPAKPGKEVKLPIGKKADA